MSTLFLYVPFDWNVKKRDASICPKPDASYSVVKMSRALCIAEAVIYQIHMYTRFFSSNESVTSKTHTHTHTRTHAHTHTNIV